MNRKADARKEIERLAYGNKSLVPDALNKVTLDHTFGKPSYLKSIRSLSILSRRKTENTSGGHDNNNMDQRANVAITVTNEAGKLETETDEAQAGVQQVAWLGKQ